MRQFGRTPHGRWSRTTGRGGTHGRTTNFFVAAARRLAWNDYEAVSVAMICRDARSTPYTYYRRFPNKRAFLYALVLVTFRERTASFERKLHGQDWENQKPQAIVREIVAEVIGGTMTVSAIGVTQLAIRIGMSKAKGAEPYLQYRAVVVDRAIKLISPKLDIADSEARVRSAIHILFAIATDEAWRHGIPFSAARLKELANSYCRHTMSFLGLPFSETDHAHLAAVIIEPQYSEDIKSLYPLTKRELRAYEKDINASRKSEFRMDEPIDPMDIVIAATRDEQRKSQQPLRRAKPKSKRHRIRVV